MHMVGCFERFPHSGSFPKAVKGTRGRGCLACSYVCSPAAGVVPGREEGQGQSTLLRSEIPRWWGKAPLKTMAGARAPGRFAPYCGLKKTALDMQNPEAFFALRGEAVSALTSQLEGRRFEPQVGRSFFIPFFWHPPARISP